MMQELLKRIENAEAELYKAKEELKLLKNTPKFMPFSGQPVEISYDNMNWVAGYFKEMAGEKFVCYTDGATELTAAETDVSLWKYCRPIPSAPNSLNWLPNTGVPPEAKLVLVRLVSKQNEIYPASTLLVSGLTWGNIGVNSISHYCILEK